MCDNNINDAVNANPSKYEIREQAFFLCFESLFSDTDIDEIADNAGDARDEIISAPAIERAKGVAEHQDEIDAVISSKLKSGWKLTRISRVALAVLRLAVYEMKYIDDDEIPVSVAINEAVELSKKFTVKEDTAFINGVLGAVAKEL